MYLLSDETVNSLTGLEKLNTLREISRGAAGFGLRVNMGVASRVKMGVQKMGYVGYAPTWICRIDSISVRAVLPLAISPSKEK